MTSFADVPSLRKVFNDSSKSSGISKLLEVLLEACNVIGCDIRSCKYSTNTVGTSNLFGDNQLEVDVKTDEIIFDLLKSSQLVHVASSEENPQEVSCGGSGYSVAFDPLDGSSIIDCNFAVGTIIGVWPGNGLVGRYGREQVSLSIYLYFRI